MINKKSKRTLNRFIKDLLEYLYNFNIFFDTKIFITLIVTFSYN